MIPQTHVYRNGREKENLGMSFCLRAPIRRSIAACLALVTVCWLLLLTTVHVQASTVTINDQAGVLNAGRVQAEAAKLPVPILIFTTKTFTGGQDELNQFTREQLPNQDSIAIGIDTAQAHISIRAGSNVQLSNSQTSDALSSAQSSYENGGNYTSATLAAIESLQNALSGGGSSENGITPLGVAVAILLGIAVVVVILFAIRRRRRGGSGNIPDQSEAGAESEIGYFGGVYPIGHPPGGNYGGNVGAGAGGSFGGGASGGFGGGAGGSLGGGSSGGGAGGHL